jgi:hypothetical protein
LNKIPHRLAALALLACIGWSGAARAEPGRYPPTYFQAGIGWSEVKTDVDTSRQQALDWMAGYRFNEYVGVQAVGFNLNSTWHQPIPPNGATLYDFSSYAGGQVVGFIPCTPYWDIFGELGAGQVHQTSATPGAPALNKTEGIVGTGVRWQIVDHVAVSLGFSYLWDLKVMHTGLRAEVNF